MFGFVLVLVVKISSSSSGGDCGFDVHCNYSSSGSYGSNSVVPVFQSSPQIFHFHRLKVLESIQFPQQKLDCYAIML